MNVKKDKLNQSIQILNCCEETKRNFPFWKWNDINAIENEKEIREKSNIYLNNKKFVRINK